jgi:hypothetical protein
MDFDSKTEELSGLFKDNIALRFKKKAAILELAHEADELIEQELLMMRANKNKCFKPFLYIAQSRIFGWIINVCIIANTVILSLDKYPIDPLSE